MPLISLDDWWPNSFWSNTQIPHFVGHPGCSLPLPWPVPKIPDFRSWRLNMWPARSKICHLTLMWPGPCSSSSCQNTSQSLGSTPQKCWSWKPILIPKSTILVVAWQSESSLIIYKGVSSFKVFQILLTSSDDHFWGANFHLSSPNSSGAERGFQFFQETVFVPSWSFGSG